MLRSSRPARRAPARGATASARIAPAPSGPAPASPPALRWAAPVLALGLGGVWLAITTSGLGRIGFPMDDPYIHLQFARNLAHGAGFSFNPHEPVPGSTSPLWVLVLAATQLVGLPAEAAAAGLGVLAAALAAVLTFDLGVACALPAGRAACAA